MRLRTTFDLADWYDRIRNGGKPVAWCSAFAPAEALIALGVQPVYPENHAAMLGALSPSRDPAAPYAREALAAAGKAGFAGPRLCSYALADLGVLAGGAQSPIGSLPDPDLFYACDSQCAVVGRWGEAVADWMRTAHGRVVPHYLLKAPPRRDPADIPAQESAFAAQLDAQVTEIAERFHLRRDPQRLRQVVAESAEANRLWQRCLELGRRSPAPWTSWDAFTAMAPIVVARGHPEATEFYRRLVLELEERVAAGHAAVPGERRRLLWDAIPIWPRKNWLARRCADAGAAVVASTYTHSWWFEFDPDDAFGSIARRYVWNTMNLPVDTVLRWTVTLAQDYRVDGVICHMNRSCGIWNSYVKRRLDGLRDAGLRVLVLEADMVDPGAFHEERITEQLQRFLGP